MRSWSEGFVGDFREESGGSPDADSRHAGQDRPKSVCMHQPFNFAGNLVALFAQRCELLGQTRHDDGCCLRTRYDHSLLAERLNDFGSKAFAHARCKFGEAVGECFLAGRGKLGG